MIEFGILQHRELKDWSFVRHKEADKLVREDANAFLFGVILDQGIDAEKAWTAPYELKMRIGHLNPENIANMPLKELEIHFSEGNKLHRFWPTMARRIRAACDLITTKYGGDAKTIWSDEPDSRTLYKRLIEFDGVGQKKASMAVNILYRDLNIEIKDPSGIDVSYDEMVRRVFFRTALVERDTMNDVIKAARKLSPEYPGELDYPAWIIGRKWCLPKNPKCAECYMGDICPKINIPGFL